MSGPDAAGPLAVGPSAPSGDRRPLLRSAGAAVGAFFDSSARELAAWIRTGDVDLQGGTARHKAHETPAPAVSVVIPCHDGAETLGVALRSLRRQSRRDWEAIVVDDGSSDRSAEVVETWMRRDPRIRLIRQSCQGVAGARNAGLRLARGAWVGFLDCDDWLSPRALAELLGLADQRPVAGVVYGGARKVLPNGRQRQLPALDLSEPFSTLCSEGGMAIHSALVRRELVAEVGGFDPGLRTSEDWDLWQRLGRAGVVFARTPATVAFYRNRAGSLSKDVQRVAADGLEVIRRGHAPDPRVPRPAPAHARGGPADSLGPRLLYFAMWCAARDVAAGGEGQAILDRLDPESRAARFQPGSLGDLMASGMADACLTRPAALGARWTEFEPKLRALVDRLDASRPRCKAILLAVIKSRLNGGRAGDPDVLQLDSPRDFRLGATLPPVLQLRWRRKTLGAVAIAADGPMSASDFADMVAAQASRQPLGPALLASACWRSPVFWSAAALRMARASRFLLAGRDAQGGGFAALRAVARGALAEGFRAHVLARLSGRTNRAAAAAQKPARVPAAPRATGCSVPILMYHRVAPAGAAGLDRYRVTPDAFEAQLARLRQEGYESVSPEQLAHFVALAAPLPQRAVMLTFDDGYCDFAEHAWPILRRYGFGATVFVVPAKVGGRADWDADHGEPAPLMDWRTLRALSDAGVAMESHSLSHPDLTGTPLRDLYREIRGSAAAIVKELGRAPSLFCYPFGAHDAVVQRVVQEAGYRAALTTECGLCRLSVSPVRVPRVEIAGQDDLETFARKLRF